MFDVSFSELVVIGLVALVVLGPKRLPEVARAAGRWTARLRRFISDVKQDFDREMHDAELTELRKLKQELDETRRVMEDTSGSLMQDLQAVPAGMNAVVAGASAATNTIAAPTTEPAPAAPRRTARKKPKRRTPSRHGRAKRTRQRTRRR